MLGIILATHPDFSARKIKMEKGRKWQGFLTKCFMGVLMVLFLINTPMNASDKIVFNEEVLLAMLLPESGKINSGFAPPVSNPTFISTEVRLEETEITTNARNISASPQILDLPTTSITPLSTSFKPRLRGNTGFTAALASTVLIQAADYYSTVRALKYSSLKEGNPFMKKITSDPLLFGVLKLGVAGLQVTLLKGLYKRNKTLAWIVGTAVNVGLSCVVANNFSKIQKARSSFAH